ncbi:MAG: hypothetical protein CMG26_05365 [Candidatus Marinimicrobia bacterium]|nr:hypothetical protein [Candidatus Neomarinimicrobiota bacterium]
MKNLIFILKLLLFTSLFGEAYSVSTISMFNFNNSSFDKNDTEAQKLSKQISSSLIDLMKHDMSFIEDVNFIPTNDLEEELISIRKSLIKEVKNKLNSDLMDIIPKSELSDIVKKISSNNLNDIQVEALTDSLAILVSSSAKNLTRKMLLSNSENEGQWGEISIDDLEKFIQNITHESVLESTFTSMIAASNKDFSTDVFVNTQYTIYDDMITVNLYLYNLDDFSLFSTITEQTYINNINVLIKQLEFKLISELGIYLNDSEKAKLCMYDLSKFSKKDNSLYLSRMFMTEDIKKLKYKMQFSDDYDLISEYYIAIISGLMENDISYNLKFYNDDNFYNVYSTESSNDNAFSVNVLKENWSDKIGVSQNLHSTGGQRGQSKMLIDIDYRYVQAIQFSDRDESFIDVLKQISIYSFIVTSGFLLIQFF